MAAAKEVARKACIVSVDPQEFSPSLLRIHSRTSFSFACDDVLQKTKKYKIMHIVAAPPRNIDEGEACRIDVD